MPPGKQQTAHGWCAPQSLDLTVPAANPQLCPGSPLQCLQAWLSPWAPYHLLVSPATGTQFPVAQWGPLTPQNLHPHLPCHITCVPFNVPTLQAPGPKPMPSRGLCSRPSSSVNEKLPGSPALGQGHRARPARGGALHTDSASTLGARGGSRRALGCATKPFPPPTHTRTRLPAQPPPPPPAHTHTAAGSTAVHLKQPSQNVRNESWLSLGVFRLVSPGGWSWGRPTLTGGVLGVACGIRRNLVPPLAITYSGDKLEPCFFQKSFPILCPLLHQPGWVRDRKGPKCPSESEAGPRLPCLSPCIML